MRALLRSGTDPLGHEGAVVGKGAEREIGRHRAVGGVRDRRALGQHQRVGGMLTPFPSLSTDAVWIVYEQTSVRPSVPAAQSISRGVLEGR